MYFKFSRKIWFKDSPVPDLCRNLLMFQAIKNLHPTRLLIFLVLAILNSPLAPSDTKEPTKELDSPCSQSKSTNPDDFYLSLAVRSQVEGFHFNQIRKSDEAKKSFERSRDHLDTYHRCLEKRGKSPSKFSAETQSLNFLELGDLENAWTWSETAKSNVAESPRELILLQTRIRIRQGNMKLAASILEEELPRFPYDFDFLYLLGSLFSEQKVWNRSLLYYTALSFSIERRDSNSKYKNLVNRTLGELNYKLDFPKISLKHYKQYVDAAPNDIEVLFRMAQIYFVLGDFGKSKFYLEEIRKKNPRDIDASYMLAEVMFMTDRNLLNSHLLTLKNENKIPKEGIVYLLNRYMNFDHQNLKEEVVEFIKKNPQRLSPKLILLGLTQKSEKLEYLNNSKDAAKFAYEYRQFQTAKNILDDTLPMTENDSNFKDEISNLYEQISYCEEMLGKPNHAILKIKNAISVEADPIKKEKFAFRLAYLYLLPSVRKEKSAIEILNPLIQKSENVSYYYLRGLAYYQLEKFDKSYEDFNKTVTLDPYQNNYYFYRAMASDKLGKFDSAEKDLYKVIELNANASNAMNYLGYMYAEKNIKQKEALSLLNSAIQIEPDNAAFQDSLGWLEYRKQNLNRSLLHLNFAASLASEREIEDPVIYDHLGDVYIAKKDPVNALVFFKLALSKSKGEDKQKLLQKIKKVEKEISK